MKTRNIVALVFFVGICAFYLALFLELPVTDYEEPITIESIEEVYVPPTTTTIEFVHDEDEFSDYKEYYDASNELNSKMNEFDEYDDKQIWFVEYKELIESYEDVIDPPESVYDYFTEEEIYLIQRMVETETYQQDFMSKVHVACVAFNRYDSDVFSDDMKKIITSPSQFAYGRKKISEDTVLAVEYAFMIEDPTEGSVGFHSGTKTKTFNGWEYVFTDNAGHHFFRIGGNNEE